MQQNECGEGQVRWAARRGWGWTRPGRGESIPGAAPQSQGGLWGECQTGAQDSDDSLPEWQVSGRARALSLPQWLPELLLRSLTRGPGVQWVLLALCLWAVHAWWPHLKGAFIHSMSHLGLWFWVFWAVGMSPFLAKINRTIWLSPGSRILIWNVNTSAAPPPSGSLSSCLCFHQRMNVLSSSFSHPWFEKLTCGELVSGLRYSQPGTQSTLMPWGWVESSGTSGTSKPASLLPASAGEAGMAFPGGQRPGTSSLSPRHAGKVW